MENETIQNTDTTSTTESGNTTSPDSITTGAESIESNVPQHSFEFTNQTTGEVSSGTIDFTGITSEQGDILAEKLDILISQTVPVPLQNVSIEGGMTAEQAQTLIDVMNNVDQGLYFLIIFAGAFFVWWVFKVLYQFIGGMIFGGL